MMRISLRFLSVSTAVLLIGSVANAGECKNCLVDGAEIDAVKQFKEIKDKAEIKQFRNYWQREIKMGQEEGPFSAFVQPISDGQDMIVTQMKTDLTCNTAGGKECDTKVILRNKKSGAYRTVFSGIYLDKDKDKMTLHGVNGKMPLIKVWNLEYEYNPEKKFYDFSANSPKPEPVEIIDPRGFTGKSDVPMSNLNMQDRRMFTYLGNFDSQISYILGWAKDIFGIKSACAGECANGMVLPSTAKITSGFGPRTVNGIPGNHKGVDYGVASGTSLPAIAEGTVIKTVTTCPQNTGNSYGNNCGGGYGNYVMIQLTNGDVIVYAHLLSVNVSEGQTVSAGTEIAKSGHSGSSTGPHLHFEVRKGGVNGERVDPVTYLDSCGATAWDGTGAAPGEGENGGGDASKNRFQVENLPWYTGGDDTLSDARYKELFETDEKCE